MIKLPLNDSIYQKYQALVAVAAAAAAASASVTTTTTSSTTSSSIPNQSNLILNTANLSSTNTSINSPNISNSSISPSSILSVHHNKRDLSNESFSNLLKRAKTNDTLLLNDDVYSSDLESNSSEINMNTKKLSFKQYESSCSDLKRKLDQDYELNYIDEQDDQENIDEVEIDVCENDNDDNDEHVFNHNNDNDNDETENFDFNCKSSIHNDNRKSFLISDILGLTDTSNKHKNIDTSSTNTTTNNKIESLQQQLPMYHQTSLYQAQMDYLIQQYQLHLQRSLINNLQFHQQQQQQQQQPIDYSRNLLQTDLKNELKTNNIDQENNSILSKSQNKLNINSSVKQECELSSDSASILSSLEKLTKNQFDDYIHNNDNSNKIGIKNNTISKKSLFLESQNSINKPESITKSDNNQIVKQQQQQQNQSNENLNTKSSNNSNNPNLWPAWVFCTRYSDRPSAGPRHRKKTKKNSSSNSSKSNTSCLNKSIGDLSSKKDVKNTLQNSNNPSTTTTTTTTTSTNSNNNNNNNNNQSYSSCSSNSSFSLASPSQHQQQHSSPFLNAINSLTKKTVTGDHKSINNNTIKYSTNENELNNNNNNNNNYSSNYDNQDIKSENNDDDDDCLNEEFYDDDNDSNTSQSKRPRTAFTSSQLNRLKHEFEKCKYLTGEKRQYLANELNLNESQIKIWFQNKRAKIKKSSGVKNVLALQLMAQGLYNHSNNSSSKNE